MTVSDRPSVLIIGAGALGLCPVQALAGAGTDAVTVIDARRVAGGSGVQSSPALGAGGADWIVHGQPRRLPAAAALRPVAA
jgi:glycine/D-amino acid oxidase-like deaminating enzyme